MIIPKRKPVTVGQILSSKMLEPMGITQQQLANTISVSRKTVNELCRDRRTLTTDIAFRLSAAFGTSPEFWLNAQRLTDLWEYQNSPSYSFIRTINTLQNQAST